MRNKQENKQRDIKREEMREKEARCVEQSNNSDNNDEQVHLHIG